MAFGTIAVSDSLSVLANGLNVPLGSLDPKKVYEIIERDLAYHNQLVKGELLPFMCKITDQVESVYGIRDYMTVEEIDEFGRPDAQKVGGGALLGLPLSSYGRSLQWTWNYLQVTSVGEFAEQYNAAKAADLNGIRLNIMRRIFNPTNNLTYRDKLINNRVLSLRSFYNADGQQVQPSQTFQQFNGATHTHYTTTNAASATGVQVSALINNVVEHGRQGKIVLFINQAQVANIRSLTAADEFTPYTDVRIRQPLSATYATDGVLDQDNPEDRAIGIFGAAQVWVKPYIPAGYMVAIDLGDDQMKPLAFRTRPNGVFSDFGTRGKTYTEDFPLYAEFLARDYGIGVINRHMAAVLQVVASPVYTQPVF